VGVCLGVVAATLIPIPLRQESVASAQSANPYENAVLEDGPVGYWRMEDRVDLGWGANDLPSNPVHVPGPFPLAGNATSSNFYLGTPPELSAQQYSIEAWAKFSSGHTGEIWRSRWYGAALDVDTQGRFSAYLAESTKAADRYTLKSVDTYADNEWHHVVVTRSPSRLALYVDGRLQAERTSGPNTYYDGGHIGISRGGNCNCQYFQGHVDEVAYYNYALGEGQILNHWIMSGKGDLSDIQRLFFIAAFNPAGFAGDPVNTATGNLVEEVTDLPGPNGVYGTDWSRTYNSHDYRDGLLGVGWSHSFAARVEPDGASINLTLPGGRVRPFAPLPGSNPPAWRPPEGVEGDLRHDAGSGRYALQFWSGERWEFNTSGRIARICEGRVDWSTAGDTWCLDPVGGAYQGQYVDLSWQGTRLETVASSTGYGLSFADTNADGRVDSVESSDGRVMTYGYQAGMPAFLALVEGPSPGSLTRYVPTAGGLIGEVWKNTPQGEQPTLVNVYDADQRVQVQYNNPSNPSALPGGDPGGDKTTFLYGAPEPNKTTVVHDDGLGDIEELVYVHNEWGHLIRLEDPFGKDITKAWTNEQLGELTDRNQAVWRNDYDSQGRLCKRWLPDPANGGVGASESFLYQGQSTPCDGVGSDPRLLEHTDASGRTTRFEYDPGDTDRVPSRTILGVGTAEQATTHLQSTNDMLVSSTDPDGVTTTFEWDTTLRRLLAQSVNGETTYYAYDQLGRRNVARSPQGNETWTTYDEAGRPLARIGPIHAQRTCDGITCNFPTIPPAGPTETYEYWPDGSLKSRTDAAYQTWSYTTIYLPGGEREEHETDPDEQVWITRYDRAGRLVAEIKPTDPDDDPTWTTTTTFEYYPLGRLRKVTDPTGRQSHYCYDDNGNQTISATGDLAGGFINCPSEPRAPLSQEGLEYSESRHDKRGRLTHEWDPAGLETRYSYDQADRLIEVRGPADPAQHPDPDTWPRLTYTLDGAGRVTQEDRNGHIIQTHYTTGGRVELTHDLATGLRTKNLYDTPGTGRLVATRGPAADPDAVDAPEVRFSYDADGRVTATTQDRVCAAYPCNPAPDAVITETLDYDPAGRPLKSRDASGVITDYVWTDRGDLESQVTAPGTSDAIEIAFAAYHFDGQPRLVRDGNNVTTEYAYSTRGDRKARINALQQTETWSFDTAGRLLTNTDIAGRTTSQTYDAH
jgi:YD repeat-containing protein